ncbi:hypothetical protein C356_00125 [Cryptococcus neoformans c45]|nr:hypothetical protein C356_00125 [Cryptococcus neoformans var. grubii c45]
MRVRPMEGSGVGGASALKMFMVVSTRHVSGLAAAMVLSAQAHSPRTAKAFLDELTESQPALTKKLGRAIPDMIPKAYRWVGEMEEEISSFITSSILRSTPITHPNPADMYQGLAQMFQRVADDVKRSQIGQGGDEVKILLDWAKRGEEDARKESEKRGVKSKKTADT